MSSDDSPQERTLGVKEVLGFDEHFSWMSFRAFVALALMLDFARDIGELAVSWVQGRALEVEQTVSVRVPSLDRADISDATQSPVDILVEDPTTGQRLVDAAWHLLGSMSLLVLFVMGLLLISDAVQDRLFARVNLVRLRIIGWIAAPGAVIFVLLDVVRTRWLAPDVLDLPWFDPFATVGAAMGSAIVGFVVWAAMRSVHSGIVTREENDRVI